METLRHTHLPVEGSFLDVVCLWIPAFVYSRMSFFLVGRDLKSPSVACAIFQLSDCFRAPKNVVHTVLERTGTFHQVEEPAEVPIFLRESLCQVDLLSDDTEQTMCQDCAVFRQTSIPSWGCPQDTSSCTGCEAKCVGKIRSGFWTRLWILSRVSDGECSWKTQDTRSGSVFPELICNSTVTVEFQWSGGVE